MRFHYYGREIILQQFSFKDTIQELKKYVHILHFSLHFCPISKQFANFEQTDLKLVFDG